MLNFLHNAAVRQRLRPLRPVYNKVFRRKKDLSRELSASELIRQMNGRGIFLFSFGRCGTRVFADFLATHPRVATFGEVLNEDSYYSFFQAFSKSALRRWSFSPSLMETEFYKFIERVVRRTPGYHCLFDLKIEGLHLIEGNWRIPGPEFRIFDALQESGAPVILMERRDLVARHLSVEIALRRGLFHSYHTGAQIEPFVIDIAKMEQANAVIRAQVDYVRKRFACYPRFCSLTYEDLFERDGTRFAAGLSSQMAGLLGIDDDFDNVPQLQKVLGEAHKTLITNIEEVEAARARLLAK